MSAVTVIMETSKGNIEIELDEVKAPITVENFLAYVDVSFFDGTLFHRTIKNFVIQGGGVLPDMTEKPTNGPIKNEALNGLSNLRGTIGMARDTAIDTATSQFFINTVDCTVYIRRNICKLLFNNLIICRSFFLKRFFKFNKCLVKRLNNLRIFFQFLILF